MLNKSDGKEKIKSRRILVLLRASSDTQCQLIYVGYYLDVWYLFLKKKPSGFGDMFVIKL